MAGLAGVVEGLPLERGYAPGEDLATAVADHLAGDEIEDGEVAPLAVVHGVRTTVAPVAGSIEPQVGGLNFHGRQYANLPAATGSATALPA